MTEKSCSDPSFLSSMPRPFRGIFRIFCPRNDPLPPSPPPPSSAEKRGESCEETRGEEEGNWKLGKKEEKKKKESWERKVGRFAWGKQERTIYIPRSLVNPIFRIWIRGFCYTARLARPARSKWIKSRRARTLYAILRFSLSLPLSPLSPPENIPGVAWYVALLGYLTISKFHYISDRDMACFINGRKEKKGIYSPWKENERF